MVDPTGRVPRVRRRKAIGAQVVVDAAIRTLARDGLDGLSVRKVAAEAGLSVGAVQHHYPTKNALLVAAAERTTAIFSARADHLAHRAFTEGGAIAAFVAFCELLANASSEPDGTGDDTGATIVWLWYAAKATQSGPVAHSFAAAWAHTEQHLAGVIAGLWPTVDAATEAAHLLAVLDGIAIARATEPQRMPIARAQMLVQRHIKQLKWDRTPDLDNDA